MDKHSPEVGSTAVGKPDTVVKEAVRKPSLLEHQGTQTVGAKLAGRTFPMYVMPISEVLKLTRLPLHEDVFDKLIKWEEGMASVLFVSQTWLSNAHPDNDDNVKLALLKDVLRMARAGELGISTHWASALNHGDLSIPAEQMQRDLEGGYVWFE